MQFSQWTVLFLLLSQFVLQSITKDETDDNLDARKALEYVELVRSRAVCTGGTEELLPVTFDHSVWSHYAEVALRMSNTLTKIIIRQNNKLEGVGDEFLFDQVRNNVDGDSPIFGSAIALEEYVYPKYRIFCPYAYKKEAIHAHDISLNYNYLDPSTEWYHVLRMKNWTTAQVSENWVIYRYNETSHDEERLLRQPMARLEDGHWTFPYYDCGGGNIWMVTYSAPIFGLEDNMTTPVFKGIGTIDIELTHIDINQCDEDTPGDGAGDQRTQEGKSVDVFRGTHRCQESTKCVTLRGLGFVRGAYVCECQDGYYFPDAQSSSKAFNGTLLETIFSDRNQTPSAEEISSFQCVRCAEGCDTCTDDSPCLYSYSVITRSSLVILTAVTMTLVMIMSLLVLVYRDKRAIKSASPIFLHVMCAGALLMCLPMFIMFGKPTKLTCVLYQWLRHLGFSLAYGALLLKTWRISAIFKVKSARRLQLSDRVLAKGFVPILCIPLVYLTVWTVMELSDDTIWLKTTSELKYKTCPGGWWEYGAFIAEGCFLLWGAYLCFVVRKAPSHFNESKYITWSIYNNVILGSFTIVVKELIAVDHGPDILYIVDFVYIQVSVTIMMFLIFIPKFYFGNQADDGLENNSITGRMTTIQISNTRDPRMSHQSVQTDITSIEWSSEWKQHKSPVKALLQRQNKIHPS